MSPIKEILLIIDYMKRSHQSLSDNDVISILKATREVSKNKALVNNLIFLYNNFKSDNFRSLLRLTQRECEILHLIGLGNQSIDIAIQLELSLSTIETHRKNIRKCMSLK